MVRVALGRQLLLHVGVEQSHLGLGQPPEAVAELPGRGQQGRLVALEALQRREGQSQELVVVGPERLTGLRPGQLPGVEEPRGQVLRQPDGGRRLLQRGGQLGVGSGYTTLAQSRL
jgi:hypothetical protein